MATISKEQQRGRTDDGIIDRTGSAVRLPQMAMTVALSPSDRSSRMIGSAVKAVRMVNPKADYLLAEQPRVMRTSTW